MTMVSSIHLRSHAQITRHPGDLVRLGVGLVALALGTIWAQSSAPDRFESDLFRLINDTPQWLQAVLVWPMQLGALLAVPVVAVLCWLLFSRRCGLLVAASGVLSWVSARLLKNFVTRGRPGATLEAVIFRGQAPSGFGFPSGHCTVAAAMATVLSPYLPRAGRRVAWSLVAIVAFARIFEGAHLPADTLGGVALGVVAGSLLNIAFGTPSPSEPTTDEIRAALGSHISPVSRIGRVHADARGSTPFVIADGDRSLFAKALSRDERDADALFKLWRRMVYRDIEDEGPFLQPGQMVEHEALARYRAREYGVRTAPVIAIVHDRYIDVLLTDYVEGSDLSTADSTMSDGMIDDLWTQVWLLRKAEIAHRDLRLSNCLMDDEGKAWLIDFGYASIGATEHELDRDIIELLASTAALVGVPRAVDAAQRSVPDEILVRCVSRLQRSVLSRETGRLVNERDPQLLDELRTLLSRRTGEAIEPPTSPYRIRARTVFVLLALALAVHLLLPQVGELSKTLETLRGARIPVLILSCFVSAATYIAATVAFVGSVPDRISTSDAFVAQVASSFANRISPAGIGGTVLNFRFLERTGRSRTQAASALGLNGAAGAIVHVVLMILVAAMLARTEFRSVSLPDGWTILVVVALGAVVIGGLLFSPFGRRRMLPTVSEAFNEVRSVLTRPSKAAQLFGGSLAVTFFYALALGLTLDAFGPAVPATVVVAVYLGGAAVGSISPTPGGLGAEEAALVAALTALRVPAPQAVSGVLAFRLVTFWLPILPGWVALRHLRRRGAI